MPITKEKISYSLNLSEKLKKIPRSKRKDAKELIGNYLLDAIFNDTESAKSPVTGRKFKALSKEYKSLKKANTGRGAADLRLTETMLPSLMAKNTTNGVKIEITKRVEKLKAFNHITGDTLPSRPFLPDDNGEAVKPKLKGANQFRTSIVRGIDDIIEDFI